MKMIKQIILKSIKNKMKIKKKKKFFKQNFTSIKKKHFNKKSLFFN